MPATWGLEWGRSSASRFPSNSSSTSSAVCAARYPFGLPDRRCGNHQAAFEPGDKLRSTNRTPGTFGAPKRSKGLISILQEQVREAGHAIEHWTDGHQPIILPGQMGSHARPHRISSCLCILGLSGTVCPGPLLTSAPSFPGPLFQRHRCLRSTGFTPNHPGFGCFGRHQREPDGCDVD